MVTETSTASSFILNIIHLNKKTSFQSFLAILEHGLHLRNLSVPKKITLLILNCVKA